MTPGGSGIRGNVVAISRRYQSVPFVVLRRLWLAGLPRLQSVASVPHCRGSYLADESHASSTQPLATVADQTATVLQHCQQGLLGSSLTGLAQIPQAHSDYRLAGCSPAEPASFSPDKYDGTPIPILTQLFLPCRGVSRWRVFSHPKRHGQQYRVSFDHPSLACCSPRWMVS